MAEEVSPTDHNAAFVAPETGFFACTYVEPSRVAIKDINVEEEAMPTNANHRVSTNQCLLDHYLQVPVLRSNSVGDTEEV